MKDANIKAMQATQNAAQLADKVLIEYRRESQFWGSPITLQREHIVLCLEDRDALVKRITQHRAVRQVSRAKELSIVLVAIERIVGG